ncbi:hypothetical protein THZG08_60076 [Vibrio owensii]|uniref:Uncharacterized protein n=1 Tax=Vibrio owensii TaxID=696485 RepID=A0AAU9QC51_9VIBR|nr:hypothetical protein THZG08_60076 [Vibrio owensii]CAH1540049.1 hypothetical protein THF1D04_60146 [Vibrio owensii]CAH1587501.1 hypothetical protein THOA03_60076 [Vibrio owensii]
MRGRNLFRYETKALYEMFQPGTDIFLIERTFSPLKMAPTLRNEIRIKRDRKYEKANQ